MSISTEIAANFEGKDYNAVNRFTSKFSMVLARKIMQKEKVNNYFKDKTKKEAR